MDDKVDAAEVEELTEHIQLLERDMYELTYAVTQMKQSYETMGGMLVELYKLIKDTHPQYNFGLGPIELGPHLM